MMERHNRWRQTFQLGWRSCSEDIRRPPSPSWTLVGENFSRRIKINTRTAMIPSRIDIFQSDSSEWQTPNEGKCQAWMLRSAADKISDRRADNRNKHVAVVDFGLNCDVNRFPQGNRSDLPAKTFTFRPDHTQNFSWNKKIRNVRRKKVLSFPSRLSWRSQWFPLEARFSSIGA